MTIEELEQGIEKVWVSKLIREWYIQEGNLAKKLGSTKRVFNVPNFCIGKVMSRWGQWSQENRMIEISLRLLRNYDWNAVVDTLKHEMAHQLVDEYIKMDGDSHGEAFKLACKLMDADSNRGIGSEALSSMTGGDEVIVTKIKKLLAKGSNDAVTEMEGEAFLQKAQELMIRYNLEIADLADSGEFFVQRPVTPMVYRWPDYFYSLGNLSVNHYNVQYIRYCTESGAYLEYFGEQANVDVAEYVTHVLLQQGESLYKEFLKAHRERRLHEVYVPKASRASFMNGLIKGYGEKLKNQRHFSISKIQNQMQEEKRVVDPQDGVNRCQDILLASSKILREHFEKKYNPCHGQRNGCSGAGYDDGHKAGGNISITPGIRGTTGCKALHA